MRTPRLRDAPAWRAMFKRIDAKSKADRMAERDRWRSLSPEEKWAEMADMAQRWRGLTPARRDRIVTSALDAVEACE
jgi:hypothetical protein